MRQQILARFSQYPFFDGAGSCLVIRVIELHFQSCRDRLGEVDQVAIQKRRAGFEPLSHGNPIDALQIDVVHAAQRTRQFVRQLSWGVHVIVVIRIAGKQFVGSFTRQDCFDMLPG